MLSRSRALSVLGGAAAVTAFPNIARGATALSVGQIGVSIAFFPTFVAQGEGYFKDAGLDVTVTPFSSGTLVGTAVTSNSIDIGTSVITDVFALLKANRPVKLVGSLVDGYYVDVIGSNQFLAAAKITRASKLNDKIKAMKGKKIGITGPGSGTQALVDFLFKSLGMDSTRDVELVNVGVDQASILTAMKTGRIDGVSFAWPLTFIAEAEGVGKGLIIPADGDVPSMRGQIQGVIYVKPDMLAKREGDVVGFVHAIGRAEQLIRTDPAKTKAYLKKFAPALSDAASAAMLASYLPVVPTNAKIGVIYYEKALNFHKITGFAGPSGNGYADVVATSIIDKAAK